MKSTKVSITELVVLLILALFIVAILWFALLAYISEKENRRRVYFDHSCKKLTEFNSGYQSITPPPGLNPYILVELSKQHQDLDYTKEFNIDDFQFYYSLGTSNSPYEMCLYSSEQKEDTKIYKYETYFYSATGTNCQEVLFNTNFTLQNNGKLKIENHKVKEENYQCS
jgi:hypothetical protein